jgi:hypothetical protein
METVEEAGAGEPAVEEWQWRLIGTIAGLVGAALVRAWLRRRRRRSAVLSGWAGTLLWPVVLGAGAVAGEAAGKRAVHEVKRRRAA